MSNGFMKAVNGRFEGDIRTMRIFLRFFLEPNIHINSQNSPTHKVMAKAPAGHIFQAGVAWERTMQRGAKAGQSMFSFSLEDPEFGDSPVNLSAFPEGDGYAIKLERKRADADTNAAPDDATAAAA